MPPKIEDPGNLRGIPNPEPTGQRETATLISFLSKRSQTQLNETN